MPLLICEGPCNPSLAALDTLVRSNMAHALTGQSKAIVGLIDDTVILRLRALRHTPHQATPLASIFTCTTCHTERAWGVQGTVQGGTS